MSEAVEDEKIIGEFEENEDTTKDLYLTFEIDGKDYAIDVIQVKEAINICAITEVPQTIDFIKGIINLRGDIVPIVSVRTRLQLEEKAYDELTCIIILEFDEYIIGLLVDQVKGVFTITEENISSSPDSNLNFENQFIKGIAKTQDGIKFMLDIYRFLF